MKIPRLYLEVELKSKDGELKQYRKLEAQSWVGNIVSLLHTLLSRWHQSTYTQYGTAITASEMTSTANAATNFAFLGNTAARWFGGNAPAGDATSGIRVGRGTLAVALGDYNLATPIDHGTGQNQMLYGATTTESVQRGTTWSFRMTRSFTNNSGATITVSEVGLCLNIGTLGEVVMLARDLLDPSVDVPDGATLTIRYIIQHSLS